MSPFLPWCTMFARTQVAGAASLAVTVVGSAVAAAVADVGAGNPGHRAHAAITMQPSLGGWLALTCDIGLVVVGWSHWLVWEHDPPPPPPAPVPSGPVDLRSARPPGWSSGPTCPPWTT